MRSQVKAENRLENFNYEIPLCETIQNILKVMYEDHERTIY